MSGFCCGPIIFINNIDFQGDMDIYDSVNPIDYRYYQKSRHFAELNKYFSENAKIKYELRVEKALVDVLAKKGICPKKIADEVKDAIKKVTPEEVYKEEERIKHDVRALVNSIKKYVSDEAKPYIHFTTTSCDILSTSEAMRLKEGVLNALIPILKELEKTGLTQIILCNVDTQGARVEEQLDLINKSILPHFRE